MADVKNVITLGIGANPGSIRPFILFGLDINLFVAQVYQGNVMAQLSPAGNVRGQLSPAGNARGQLSPTADVEVE